MTLLAIVVAMVGLYSVVSVSVANRKQDMAIKAAIGASPRAVATEVLGNAARQVGVGLAIGVTAGVVASNYMRTMVQGFQVAPATLLGVVLGLLFCAGIAACLAPAMRAARIDPANALREI
jgi:ABC-type antimicrobial peptide transport system permease subunit